MMSEVLSILTAIAVYGRLCEMGHNAIGIICGVLAGMLAQYGFQTIKKSAGEGNSEQTIQ